MVSDEEVEAWVQSHYTAPEIEFNPDNWLWANDWYDGPLCGIMIHNGQIAWFDWIDEASYEVPSRGGEHWFSPRVYSVRQLSISLVKQEIEQMYHYRRIYGNWLDLGIDDTYMEILLKHFSIEPRIIRTEEEYQAQYPEKDYHADGDGFFNFGYRQRPLIGWFVERYNPKGPTRPVTE